jgi:hypothetical protein
VGVIHTEWCKIVMVPEFSRRRQRPSTAILPHSDRFGALRASVGIVLLAFCSTGMAAPTLLGTTTDPTGINGLVVDGLTYNVTFSTTTFDSPFTGGTSASQDAANAIAAVFSTAGVTELGPTALSPLGFYVAYVDNGFDMFNQSEGTHCEVGMGGGACSTSHWVFEGGASLPLGAFTPVPGIPPFGYAVAADFTPVSSSVPEPATLALLTVGLVGVGFFRRRAAR